MGTWAQYGAGMWDARPSEQGVQDVPRYPASVPATNWLIGLGGLVVLAFLAHKYLGGKK